MVEKRHSSHAEAFYRKQILPEEDKAEPTPPRCGFRWFRSKNIVCLEHYRKSETKPAPQQKVS